MWIWTIPVIVRLSPSYIWLHARYQHKAHVLRICSHDAPRVILRHASCGVRCATLCLAGNILDLDSHRICRVYIGQDLLQHIRFFHENAYRCVSHFACAHVYSHACCPCFRIAQSILYCVRCPVHAHSLLSSLARLEWSCSPCTRIPIQK